MLGSITLATALVYTTVQEFWAPNRWDVIIDGVIPAHLPLKVQGGSYYTGFILNLIMSIVYVFMHMSRNSLDGQSFQIALNKWLGTLAAYFFMVSAFTVNNFVHVLYIGIFVFDVLYMYMMYIECKKQNINPWLRA
ncbi:MAG: hypothetical protein KBD78_04995 [Oligoflexales bacterium]|nr:hypothetical protein [Oligoflexales bacterium]